MSNNNYDFVKTLPTINENHRKTLIFITAVISPVLSKSDILEKVSISECDWMNIFATADRGLVAPLLYSCICEKGLESVCPEDFIEALKVYFEANQTRNAKHREILLESVGHLNNIGIQPTLLKGAHALVGLLPHSSSRIISDIDLLIPENRLQEALDVLLSLGYYFDSEATYTNSPDSHQLDALFHPSGDGYLELHRRPNYSERYTHLLSNCFELSNLSLKTVDGVKFYTLIAWQLLIYNQVHHFHSFLRDDSSFNEYPDMRFLAEQAGLFTQINNHQKLIDCVESIFQDDPNVCIQQFYLLRELFGIKLPEGLHGDEAALKLETKYSIGRLLHSKGAKYNFRKRYLAKLLKRIDGLGWCKDRLLSLKWYKSRPYILKLHLKNLK